jgi:hypothetical protein
MDGNETINVFVSYSSEDRDFADKLVEAISKDQTSIFYDKYNINVGDIIPGKISDAIRNSQFFICMLSPGAIESQWVKAEWSAAIMRALSKGDPIIVPLLYKHCEIPSLLSPMKYIDFTDPGKFEDGINQLRDRIGVNLIGDDNRYRDENLFNMPNKERKRLFSQLLRERRKLLRPKSLELDHRCSKALDQFHKQSYHSEFSGKIFLMLELWPIMLLMCC